MVRLTPARLSNSSQVACRNQTLQLSLLVLAGTDTGTNLRVRRRALEAFSMLSIANLSGPCLAASRGWASQTSGPQARRHGLPFVPEWDLAASYFDRADLFNS